MIVNVTELGRGDILEIDGDPWQATEVQSQTPSARGASLLVKAKVKNLRTALRVGLQHRHYGEALRLEVSAGCSEFLSGFLQEQFALLARQKSRPGWR